MDIYHSILIVLVVYLFGVVIVQACRLRCNTVKLAGCRSEQMLRDHSHE